MSIELARRAAGVAPDRPRALLDASPGMPEAPDAARIARTLVDKYGVDALTFAQQRTARAAEIGDELALADWRRVIAATRSLLRPHGEV